MGGPVTSVDKLKKVTIQNDGIPKSSQSMSSSNSHFRADEFRFEQQHGYDPKAKPKRAWPLK